MATRRIGHITFKRLEARDVDGARHEILNLVQRTNNGTTIYLDGWNGLGAAAVLGSIAQVLQSMKHPRPEFCFGRIIFIDCSTWNSKRVMQRRIAEELKLDHKIMAMFEKQDYEDDFNGVDLTSRDAIQNVARAIYQILRDSRFMMIFLNGSDEEVVLSRLGVPEYHEGIIMWAFKRRFPTFIGLIHAFGYLHVRNELPSKLRYTNIFLYGSWYTPYGDQITSSEFSALVREEAASIPTRYPCMQDNDRAMVIDCYLYVLFLHSGLHKGTSSWLWAAHGSDYWICDGIIQGERTKEFSKALYQEVSLEYGDASFLYPEFKRELMPLPESCYLVFDDDSADLSRINVNRHRRWISITSKKMIYHEDIKNILAKASSILLPFEMTHSPQELPDDLIERCSNLRVLILCYCAFNFLSPLFRHCHTLRFLGLDHCRNNYTAELVETGDYNAKWACLHSLLVLDLRYTDWDEILSEENMDLMGNIMELNIEGSKCWQYTGQLEGRLPYIERLRLVKPLDQADTSVEIENSFVKKTKLEVLDLSGNKDMKNLPTSLSKAINLEVIVLDGCDGLENVVLSNPLLRSFSFDGYGAASNWASIVHELPQKTCRPKCASNEKDVNISLIALEGCTELRNLFLRGLPNLVELDLSGCAIKVLDFETMVVDVPRLKRLFLLGCESLCAIRWPMIISDGIVGETTMDLELLCIDTRPTGVGLPGRTRPFTAQQPNNSFGLQVHAITADARLLRSLWAPIHRHFAERDVLFDIRITSSDIGSDEKTSEELHVVGAASLYDDVFPEVIGDSSLIRVQAFPQPPASRLDRHIEIGDGSYNVGSEVEVATDVDNLFDLMRNYVQSVHVHDTWASNVMPTGWFRTLQWCRVERCPRLDPVFRPGSDPRDLETIWASHLLMARCICSKGRPKACIGFRGLRHLHLRSCPSLRFALPIWKSSFPILETLHIIHCGSLRHVFALDNKKYDIKKNIQFPELTTIDLHDVPALQQICETNNMVAPKLETIRSRGCWSLRRLPALGSEAAGQRKRPSVEMEKDVWDALEWDGADAGHHPSLYEAPLHSRYYKPRRLLRGTVLR